jgi:hypothetical protein
MERRPFPRSTPESQGIRSGAVLEFVEAADRDIRHLHSVMLLRRGAVIAEGYWDPYRAADPHMLFSLSKSFTSTAVGMLVAEGRLTVEDPVLRYFPDEADAAGPTGRASVAALLPGAARRARAGHALRLQLGGDLHAVGNRPAIDGPAGRRVSGTTAVRAALDRGTDLGDLAGGHRRRRLGPERAHGGHRPVRAALPARRGLAGPAARAAGVGGRSYCLPGAKRRLGQPQRRLAAGLRLPVLALPPRRLPG